MKEIPNIQLSIIVPVYNVEDYIRPCMESIFRQGIGEEFFEVIIINDGTKDHSIDIIQDIIDQHKNIIVIYQEHQGLSVARNNGISISKGKYIIMLDSDDLLIDNALKPLLDKAIKSRADMVVADYIMMSNDEINNIRSIPQKDLCITEKTGEELYLEDFNTHDCFVWHTLYRKAFLWEEKIQFYPGIRYEDIPFTHECYLKANKCLRASWILYIYRKRPGSITYYFNKENALGLCIAIGKTWNLRHIKKFSDSVDYKLREDVWTSFTAMIRLTCQHIKKDKDRIEIINCLRNEVHKLSFKNGNKQRIIIYLINNMPHTFIRLRYLYKLIIEDWVLPFYYHHLHDEK